MDGNGKVDFTEFRAGVIRKVVPMHYFVTQPTSRLEGNGARVSRTCNIQLRPCYSWSKSGATLEGCKRGDRKDMHADRIILQV